MLMNRIVIFMTFDRKYEKYTFGFIRKYWITTVNIHRKNGKNPFTTYHDYDYFARAQYVHGKVFRTYSKYDSYRITREGHKFNDRI